MGNFYVDTAADLGGDGTTTALTGEHCAFKTLAQVSAASFSPDDFIMFRKDRLWRELLDVNWSGTLGHPITITSYGTGAQPTITGTDIITGWTQHEGNIWQADLATEPYVVIFDGEAGVIKTAHDDCTASGHWAWEEGVLYCYSTTDPDTAFTDPGVEAGIRDCIDTGYTANRNYIVLDDIAGYGSKNYSVFAYRATGWVVDGCTFTDHGRTGLYLRGVDNWTITGSTVTGIRTNNAVWRGIYFYADSEANQSHHNTVTLSTIQYWSGNSVHFQGSNSTYRTHDNVCTHNDLSHSASGLRLTFCDDSEVAYNTMDDCRPGGYPAAESYSMALRSSSRNNVHHNTMSDSTQGMEIWAYDGSAPYTNDGPSDGNWVHRNKIYGMDNYGFLIYEGCCSYTRLEYNLIWGNKDAGIHITENTGAGVGNVIYNNTLYGNDTDNAGYADMYWGSACAGWTFKNNILMNTNRFCLHTHAGALFAHGNNHYYRETGDVVDINGTGYDITEVVNWESTCTYNEPKFVSTTPGSEDFHLQSDSFCIDTAEDVGLETDIEDNPIV